MRFLVALLALTLVACGSGGPSPEPDPLIAPVVTSWVRPDPQIPDAEETDGRFGIRSYLPDFVTRVEVWADGELVLNEPVLLGTGGLWLADDGIVPVGNLALRVHAGGLTYVRGFLFDPPESGAAAILLSDREWDF